MKNTMDDIWVRCSYNLEGIPLPRFLALDEKKLNSFEYTVLEELKRIYEYNEKYMLFRTFPKRDIPTVIDCTNFDIKSGWTAIYSGVKNRILLSSNLTGEDL